jgi:tryptophan 2,3-dioxygenase
MLRPASGFQSYQFKVLEAKLGLKFEHRHGQNYYTSRLKEKDIAIIKDAESGKSVIELLNAWLERMPLGPAYDKEAKGSFWNDYRDRYKNSLADVEKDNLASFDELFFEKDMHQAGVNSMQRSLSPGACRAALFIMLYRGYPLLQLPFQLLNDLLEIDEQLSSWRYRHMNMVHRMIGSRIGTGGSTGKDYLKDAADKHYIFKEIAQLNSFLIERRKLPLLPSELEKRLGFVAS